MLADRAPEGMAVQSEIGGDTMSMLERMRPLSRVQLTLRVTRCAALVLGLVASLLGPLPAAADDSEEAKNLGQALKEGKFSLGLRYRFEQVDDDRFAEDAHASTLRTTIGYSSKPLHGFAAHLEVEDVTAIGGDAYDNAGARDLGNGVGDRPVVADPELIELNQAYLAYTGFADTELRAGRFERNLDNQRFIGAVGWRQNHQSFDGLAFDVDAIEDWQLRYVYLDRVHTVTGARQPLAGHLLNVGVETGIGRIAVYGYRLDYDDPGRFRFSSSTVGARLEGKREVAPGALGYLVEVAQQDDAGDNPVPTDVAYLHAMLDWALGAAAGGWSFRVGLESIEGVGRAAFQFPLGTNHAFNGYADKFLVTPDAGLEDLYARIAWGQGSWQAFADYHRFESDAGGVDYGSELDLQVTWATTWKQQLALKAAFYDADAFSTDTTKLMLWTSWAF